MRHYFVLSLMIVVLLAANIQPAAAYIGPGAGVSAMGTVLALVGAVFLAIVGFVWYPAKRILHKLKNAKADEQKSSQS